MLVLPELQIQAALTQGFSAIGGNVALLDDIFVNYPPAMLAEVKKYLTEHKVEVVLNLPREGMTMPVIAILNAGESEAANNDTLGDFFNDLELAPLATEYKEYRGVALQGTYQVYVLSQDPRLTMYLAYLVMTMLVLNAPTFQAAGMHNITMNTADLRFEEGLLPEWSNSRMVTLSCLHYHAVPLTDQLLKNLIVDVDASIATIVVNP